MCCSGVWKVAGVLLDCMEGWWCVYVPGCGCCFIYWFVQLFYVGLLGCLEDDWL